MQLKILSFFVMLLGLIILSPSVISVNAATNTPLSQQHIYSVMERDSPSPYHVTLVVRTGLNTNYVWIRQSDGSDNSGLLVSYGESQQVWQISYMPTQGGSRSIVINANHAMVMDENLVSLIFQVGYDYSQNAITNNSFESQTPTTSTVTITTTQPTSQSYEQAEVQHVITEYNHEGNSQTVGIGSAVTWHGINIIGDEPFVWRTLQAMEIIENGPQWAYDYVVTYLDYIKQSTPTRQGTGGHINVRTRTFYVFTVTYNHSAMWYASAFVHEAVHARQFREYLDSRNPTSRRITFYSTFADQMRIEMEALEIQIRFLEDAGASPRLINMARSLVGTVWWR